MDSLTQKKVKEEIEKLNNFFMVGPLKEEHIQDNQFNLWERYIGRGGDIENIIDINESRRDHSGFFLIKDDINSSVLGKNKNVVNLNANGILKNGLMIDGKIVYLHSGYSDDIDHYRHFAFFDKNASLSYDFFDTMRIGSQKPAAVRSTYFYLNFWDNEAIKEREHRLDPEDRIILRWYQPEKESENYSAKATLRKTFGDWKNPNQTFDVEFKLSQEQLKQIVDMDKEGITITNIGELAEIVNDAKYRVDNRSEVGKFKYSCKRSEEIDIGTTAGELLQVMKKYKSLMMQ
jgi:hypothetical protein